MPWFVIYTKPRQEKKVTAQLLANEIDAFYPLITTIKQWSDRKKKVTSPLINSYVFCSISRNWPLKSICYFGCGKICLLVEKTCNYSRIEIKLLRELTTKIIMDLSIKVLKKGDDFQVPSGLFKDKKGQIEEVRNNSLKIKLKELGIVVTIQLWFTIENAYMLKWPFFLSSET